MYANKTIKEYLKDLSLKKPTPGGGSVAALTAALACALISMVANFSNPKKNKRVKEILREASKKGKRLLKLVDKDVIVYKKVIVAIKKSQRTKIQKLRRGKAIQGSLKEALEIPEDICRLSYQGLKLTKELLGVSNKNLISDTAMSAILFEAAYKSAIYNVKINLKSIKDGNFKKKTDKDFILLSKKVKNLKEKITKEAGKVL